MSNTRIGLSALALAGMIGTAVLAQTGDGQSSGAKAQSANQADQSKQSSQQQQQQQSSQQQQQQQQAPEGWVLIQERVVVVTANEPQNHFLRAQEHLAGGRAKEAAAEARIGAEYLGMQAARAAGGADQKLTAAADALRQQAEQIARASGDAQQLQQHGQQLSETFARANAALASHFQSLAKRDLQNQRNIMAGHDLEAAADSLTAAFAWSGKQPQQDALTAIRDAQQAAAQLMTAGTGGGGATAQGQGGQAGEPQTAGARIDEKGGQAPANVSQVLDKLGNAIQQSAGSFQQGGSSSGSGSGSGSGSDQSKSQQQQQGQQQTGQAKQPAR